MISMAAQFPHTLNIPSTDHDTDMLSDTQDHIEIDVDVNDGDGQDVDAMLEDIEDGGDTNDEIMQDGIVDDTILRSEMYYTNPFDDEFMDTGGPALDSMATAVDGNHEQFDQNELLELFTNPTALDTAVGGWDTVEDTTIDIDVVEAIEVVENNRSATALAGGSTANARVEETNKLVELSADESALTDEPEKEAFNKSADNLDSSLPKPAAESEIKMAPSTGSVETGERSPATGPADDLDAHSLSVEPTAEDNSREGAVEDSTTHDTDKNFAENQGEHKDSPVEKGHEDEAGLSDQEADDYYDEIGYAALINYQGSQLSLFPPTSDTLPETYLLQDSHLAESSINQLFKACREVLGDSVGEKQALEMEIELLGLIVDEDSPNCSGTSLATILDVYHRLSHNDGVHEPLPLSITLKTRSRFSARLAELFDAADESKGLLVLAADASVNQDHLDTHDEISNQEAEPVDLDHENYAEGSNHEETNNAALSPQPGSYTTDEENEVPPGILDQLDDSAAAPAEEDLGHDPDTVNVEEERDFEISTDVVDEINDHGHASTQNKDLTLDPTEDDLIGYSDDEEPEQGSSRSPSTVRNGGGQRNVEVGGDEAPDGVSSRTDTLDPLDLGNEDEQSEFNLELNATEDEDDESIEDNEESYEGLSRESHSAAVGQVRDAVYDKTEELELHGDLDSHEHFNNGVTESDVVGNAGHEDLFDLGLEWDDQLAAQENLESTKESGSPSSLRKRSWREHSEGIELENDDQEVKRVKST